LVGADEDSAALLWRAEEEEVWRVGSEMFDCRFEVLL
jgi:hypothetical protein